MKIVPSKMSGLSNRIFNQYNKNSSILSSIESSKKKSYNHIIGISEENFTDMNLKIRQSNNERNIKIKKNSFYDNKDFSNETLTYKKRNGKSSSIAFLPMLENEKTKENNKLNMTRIHNSSLPVINKGNENLKTNITFNINHNSNKNQNFRNTIQNKRIDGFNTNETLYREKINNELKLKIRNNDLKMKIKDIKKEITSMENKIVNKQTKINSMIKIRSKLAKNEISSIQILQDDIVEENKKKYLNNMEKASRMTNPVLQNNLMNQIMIVEKQILKLKKRILQINLNQMKNKTTYNNDSEVQLKDEFMNKMIYFVTESQKCEKEIARLQGIYSTLLERLVLVREDLSKNDKNEVNKERKFQIIIQGPDFLNNKNDDFGKKNMNNLNEVNNIKNIKNCNTNIKNRRKLNLNEERKNSQEQLINDKVKGKMQLDSEKSYFVFAKQNSPTDKDDSNNNCSESKKEMSNFKLVTKENNIKNKYYLLLSKKDELISQIKLMNTKKNNQKKDYNYNLNELSRIIEKLKKDLENKTKLNYIVVLKIKKGY